MNADEEKGERKYMDHRKKYFERTLYIYIFDVLFHFDAGSNILIIVALEKMNNRRNLTNLSFILVKIFI